MLDDGDGGDDINDGDGVFVGESLLGVFLNFVKSKMTSSDL